MKWFIGGVLAIVPSVCSAQETTDSRTLGSPEAAVSDEALAEGAAYRVDAKVGITVSVGADGKVKDCVVTQSSGKKKFDKAACEGMQRYATFTPNTDANGSPIEGTYSTTMVYRGFNDQSDSRKPAIELNPST